MEMICFHGYYYCGNVFFIIDFYFFYIFSQKKFFLLLCILFFYLFRIMHCKCKPLLYLLVPGLIQIRSEACL